MKINYGQCSKKIANTYNLIRLVEKVDKIEKIDQFKQGNGEQKWG